MFLARFQWYRRLRDGKWARVTGYNRAYASHLLCHYRPARTRKEKAQGHAQAKKTMSPSEDPTGDLEARRRIDRARLSAINLAE
jgi:hypothetical protein